jgi:hypothetical protein
MGSGIFYSGTKDEVQLGDRVMIKRWLRKPLLGRVCYIPGISPKHRELEYEDVRRWAIRLDDDRLQVMGYFPQYPISRSCELIARGQGGEVHPDEFLEEPPQVAEQE